ncbi:uncharacterized protein ACRADG_008812 [Cochliomyia hominivorax]
MFSLNISCTVCKETFKNTDSIYATQCGHVFHYFCINKWLSRSSSCPYCKSYNPESRRIYFNFNNDDESMDFEKTVNNLKSQLKDSVDKVFNLSTKLQKSTVNVKSLKELNSKNLQKIDDIQRLYNISENWRAEFQDKIHELTEENEKLKEKLKSNINVEDVTTNQTDEEITELRADNLKLNKKINEIENSKMVLNCKIEMLEQRLKHLNVELKKQITENINRPINNLFQIEKLQNDSCNQQKIIDKANSNYSLNSDNIKGSRNSLKEIESDHNDDSLKDNNSCINQKFYYQKSNSNNSGGTVTKTQSSQNASRRDRKFILAIPNDCKVIIKDFPRKELTLPLKNLIIDIANIMSINLVTDDILNVSIIDKNVLAPKLALLVEFKKIDTKVEFLSNRNRLKSCNTTKLIQIKEYIDETIYPIFMYANRNLRSNGYEYICCKNNKVIAKKSINDATEIEIKSKDEVDRLIGRTFNKPSIECQIKRYEKIRKNRIPIPKCTPYDYCGYYDYYD